jgi:hypothetical protein
MEAANRFRSSAEAFMEHVHLLTEARSAYQQAMSASTELRNRLDAGDQTLRSVMTYSEVQHEAQRGQFPFDSRGATLADAPELVALDHTHRQIR